MPAARPAAPSAPSGRLRSALRRAEERLWALLGDPAAGLERLARFLRNELADYPGRAESVARTVLACALVVLLSQTLEVPYLAVSLIVVFLCAQENTVLTRLSGLLMVIGATLGVALTIGVLRYTIDVPPLRLLGCCLVGFGGLFFMRASPYGAVGFVVALVAIYGQSMVDLYAPEALVRALLWFWVAVCYAIAVAVAVNMLFLPPHPGRLLAREALRQIDEVRVQIAARRNGSAAPRLSAAAAARGVVTLHRHLTFATRGSAVLRADRGRHLARIAALDRMHTAAAHLSALPPEPLDPAQARLADRIDAGCLRLKQAVATARPFGRADEPPLIAADDPATGRVDGPLREMAHALETIAQADRTPPEAPPVARAPILAPDALRNPVYARFALKTLLATLLGYVFYTLVQWPGIHTVMLTSILIALPSLGAASHKGVARAVGCALGSLVALAATLFVIPHIDSIVGLLLLTLPILALSAWVAAGSPRINYVGVQLMFAYAMAQLGHFGPSIDLTEIRDRMMGVLLGVGLFIWVSIALWPEREGAGLRDHLARLLRGIGALIRAGEQEDGTPPALAAVQQARMRAWALLEQNREVQARVALEPGWNYDHDSVSADLTGWLAQAQETLFGVNGLLLARRQGQGVLPEAFVRALDDFLTAAAARLDHMADRCVAPAAAPALSVPALSELSSPEDARAPEAASSDPSLAQARAALERCRAALPADAPEGARMLLTGAAALNDHLIRLGSGLPTPPDEGETLS